MAEGTIVHRNSYIRYQLHARSTRFAWKVSSAQNAIGHAIDTIEPWYVAFSGGKDSTVLLDMVLNVEPDVVIMWGDDGWDYPETLQFLSDTEARYGFKLIRVRNRGNIAGFARWAGHEDWQGSNPGPWDYECNSFDDHSRLVLNLGFRGVFLGLRQEESVHRRMWLRKSGKIYFVRRERLWHACPLSNWTVDDIWAYIVAEKLPYNPVYDRLEALGVEPKYQRVGPLTAWGLDRYAVFKRGWPDLFNCFAAEFPEARRYI